jgi:hypothetical protein
MGMGSIRGTMGGLMSGNGKKMLLMDSVLIVGLIRDSTEDNGKIIRCMALVSMYGVTVSNTWGNIRII